MSDHAEILREKLACPYMDAVDPPMHSGCRWCAEMEPAVAALEGLLAENERLRAALAKIAQYQNHNRETTTQHEIARAAQEPSK